MRSQPTTPIEILKQDLINRQHTLKRRTKYWEEVSEISDDAKESMDEVTHEVALLEAAIDLLELADE